MQRSEYLKKLAANLRQLPQKERDEILADYAEHFDVASASGKTDAEVIAALGSPKSVAKSCFIEFFQNVDSTELYKNKELSIVGLLVGLLILAPMNFIFFLGPFLFGLLALVVLWLIPLMLMYGLYQAIPVWGHVFSSSKMGLYAHFSFAFWLLALVSGSFLFLLINFYITSKFKLVVQNYFKWNLSLIKERS